MCPKILVENLISYLSYFLNTDSQETRYKKITYIKNIILTVNTMWLIIIQFRIVSFDSWVISPDKKIIWSSIL